MLHALVCAFEFAPAVPQADVALKHAIVTRPCLRSRPDEGAQLPLLVRRV
jgi:hypothetical protein